jgi:phage-related minor tail protein
MTTQTTGNFPDVFHQMDAAAGPFQTQDLATAKALLDQIAASGAKATSTLASGFQNASANGKTLNAVLLSVAQSLAKTAVTSGAQLLAQGISAGANAALGDAFSAAPVAPFADGGVVASPTYFGAGGGSVGLMGERGAEAILPLARGPNGQLGVAAQDGARAPVAVTVNIAAQDVESFKRSESQIASALARAVARGQRNL